MVPGMQIRVRSPVGHGEVVRAIPPRSEWSYDGNRPYFRVRFGGGIVAGGGGVGDGYGVGIGANAVPIAATSASAYNPHQQHQQVQQQHVAASAYNPYENPMNGPSTTTAVASSIGGHPQGAMAGGVGDVVPAASSVPPHSTEWRHFREVAPFHYGMSVDFTPVGLKPVPHIPRGMPSSYSGLPPNGRHKALLVGINYEGTRARLRGCVNDAKCMMNLLRRNGYPDDGSHMLLLSDERSRGKEYQPTSENILKALKWFMKDVRRGDVLFFHFSGHGGQVPDKSGHESDGYNETIVPVDFQRAGQITDDVLWTDLVHDLPEGSRLTALMDMCHSGTGLDLPYDYDVNARRWKEDTNPAHSAGDVVLFSGCEDSQTSADVMGGYAKMAGGAMTTAFASAYEQTAAVSTYHDFLEVVRRQLKSKGFKQRPQLTSSQMFEAESRIFSLGSQASFGGGGGGGLPSYIEPNHNATIGRDKRRHVRPARQGLGGGGRNDMFAMAGGIMAGAIIADMFF
jgi:hypothetical protein